MSLRGDVTLINNASGAPAPITVPTTTVVYSHSFTLNYGQAFGIWLKAANGSGTAEMKVELEQGRKLPTTEGASDADWVVGDNVAPIYTDLNDTLAHIKTVTPVPMKYGRLKITGLNANPADATLTAWLFQQEFVC